MLRSEFLNGNLTLPPQFKHLNTYSQFNKMLDDNYQKKWNVHAAKADSDHKKNIDYFARYLNWSFDKAVSQPPNKLFVK